MTRRTGPAARTTTERRDLHAELTAKIIAQIEAGAGEFQMPWHRPGIAFTIPTNALTGAKYRGSNILWLWMAADEKKFQHQVYATYRQWSELGAQVRGGEKGNLIVKVGEWIPKEAREKAAETGDDEDAGKRLYAKPAHVFNIDQVDAPLELRTRLLPPEAPRADLTIRLAHVDAYVAAIGILIREGGSRAFYRHRDSKGEGDFIQMPPRELFTGTATSTPTEAYYATLLHEEIHGSGAEHRLNRQLGRRHGTNEVVAREEMIAEIGAAFLCAELEVTNVPRPDHSQYVASWLTVLRNDTRAIFTAAASASAAVDYLNGLQPREPEPPSDECNAASRLGEPGGVA